MHRDRHRTVLPPRTRRDDTTDPELVLEAVPRRMTRLEADRASIALLAAIVLVLALVMFAALAISSCEASRAPRPALSALDARRAPLAVLPLLAGGSRGRVECGGIHTIVAPASAGQEAR